MLGVVVVVLFVFCCWVLLVFWGVCCCYLFVFVCFCLVGVFCCCCCFFVFLGGCCWFFFVFVSISINILDLLLGCSVLHDCIKLDCSILMEISDWYFLYVG